MPEAKEAVARLFVLLRHIPAYNHTATTTFLEKLGSVVLRLICVL